MSECVVRMEMPTKDRMCQMADDIDGVWYCHVMKKLCRQPDNGEMPSWCPIICQHPEGHGPLVDSEQDVSKYITIWDCNCSEFGRQTVMAVEDLQYLPIIVPGRKERNMSECVVRMEMPKSCYDCEIRDDKAYCPICGATLVGYKRSRHENCPIICQLPEGHGRLIDANTIIGVMQDELDNDIPVTVDDYLGLDPSVPTIVPAERSET